MALTETRGCTGPRSTEPAGTGGGAAAVDRQGDPGHECRLTRREVQGGERAVAGSPHTSEMHVRQTSVALVVEVGVSAFVEEVAQSGGVAVDVVGVVGRRR